MRNREIDGIGKRSWRLEELGVLDCMYVYVKLFGGTSIRAYTRTQARGVTPQSSGVSQTPHTTSHGLSAGR